MQAESSAPPAARATDARKLAAFVHADMVDYSRLIGEDDSGTYARLARLRHALIDPVLERYGGKVVNTAGDSLLVEFSSVPVGGALRGRDPDPDTGIRSR